MLFRVHVRDDAGKRVPLIGFSYLTRQWRERSFRHRYNDALASQLCSRRWDSQQGRRKWTFGWKLLVVYVSIVCLYVWLTTTVLDPPWGWVGRGWQYSLPIAVPIVFVALLVLTWRAMWRWEYSKPLAREFVRHGFCGSCGYPISESGEPMEQVTCPECGATWKHVGSAIATNESDDRS